MEKKYKLKQKLTQLQPIEKYALLLTLNRSPRTLEQWCAIPKGSEKEIPTAAIDIICEKLACTPGELLNS
jgi:hypothetical protein